jgi:hypothetical protein
VGMVDESRSRPKKMADTPDRQLWLADLEYRLQIWRANEDDETCAQYLIANRVRLLPHIVNAAARNHESPDETVVRFIQGVHGRHMAGLLEGFMKEYIIVVISLEGQHIDRMTSPPPAGAMLCSYDPDAFGGFGEAVFTTDRSKAMRFSSALTAMEYYYQQSKVVPLRPDGQPNRPLTAYTISIEEL